MQSYLCCAAECRHDGVRISIEHDMLSARLERTTGFGLRLRELFQGAPNLSPGPIGINDLRKRRRRSGVSLSIRLRLSANEINESSRVVLTVRDGDESVRAAADASCGVSRLRGCFPATETTDPMLAWLTE